MAARGPIGYRGPTVIGADDAGPPSSSSLPRSSERAPPVVTVEIPERFLKSVAHFAGARRAPAFDFATPAGEPALAPSDGVAWRVFKNPVALFVGGVTAVVLELAEPRVRSGVWDHTTFRTDPLGRMERTGTAAMATVYGARSSAERLIAGVRVMHARVSGRTPDGTPYRADDVELLDWVQATASFGFLEAYCAYVRPLAGADRDRFWAEGVDAARLYGALGAPASCAGFAARLETMLPKLERSPIVFEFLDLMRRTRILPAPLAPLQWLLVRAGVELLPPDVRDVLELGERVGVGALERSAIGLLGAIADRIAVPSSPPVEACRRMGLPGTWLYRR
jgi:uncharacterized protein (DUF2236 family)